MAHPHGLTPEDRRRLAALTRRAYLASAGGVALDEPAEDEAPEDEAPEDEAVEDEAPHEKRAVSSDAGVGVGGGAVGGNVPAPGEPRQRHLADSSRPSHRWAVGRAPAMGALAVVALIAAIVVWRSIGATGGMTLEHQETPTVPDRPAATGEEVVDDAAARAHDAGEPAGIDQDDGSPPGAEDGGSPGDEAEIAVHVAGAVAAPGVVVLPPGARVDDALEAAGGAVQGARLDAVNLATPVSDGQQVYVPTEDEVPDGGAPGVNAPGGSTTGTTPTGPQEAAGATGTVSLNTATSSELQTLPGIGPALADRILAHREQYGPFHSVEELLEVSGIGSATMERFRDRVTT